MTKIRIESVPDLIRKTGDIRKAVVRAARNIPGMHFGGPMSAVDPAVMIYYKYLGFDPDNLDDPERNMVILSKGHNGILFYTIYVDMGMYTDEELYGKYNTIDGVFGPHPNRKTIKGIEVSTGSQGHGLNWAVGISHARQDMGIKARTFVLLGDGEMEEGSNWEAILYAASHHQDDIVAVVDFNNCSASFETNENNRWGEKGGAEGLADAFRAFGWNAMVVDGQDIAQMDAAFASIPEVTYAGKPTVIICDTIKGAGVKFMSDRPYAWHQGGLDDEKMEEALALVEEYTQARLKEVE